MNITRKLQQMARQYMQQALLGAWAKSGKGEYRRCTGEVVVRRGSSWEACGMVWQSAYAAMSHVDYLAKKGS